jgi:hydrogenase-4 component H
MLLSKVREAVICLRAGRVTLPYPAQPRPPAPGFRGQIAVDADLCIGCGGCANVCPAGVVVVRDLDQHTRALDFVWRRCTYCGRCEEVCPEEAIRLTERFETATDDPADLSFTVEIFMGPCQRCGRCFAPPTPLERMMAPGFRAGGEPRR